MFRVKKLHRAMLTIWSECCNRGSKSASRLSIPTSKANKSNIYNQKVVTYKKILVDKNKRQQSIYRWQNTSRASNIVLEYVLLLLLFFYNSIL